VKASYVDVTPSERIKSPEALYSKLHASVVTRAEMQPYALLGYQRSNGEVFTICETLSGHENVFQRRFEVEISKIVKRLVTAFAGCSV